MRIPRNLHKVWAIVLVVALCLCALPMVALAEGVLKPSESGVGSREFNWTLTNGGASNAVTSNAKYNLTGDLTGVTEPFYIGTESAATTVILDLKGHSITSAKRAFIVCPGSSLTIKDSVGGGKVQGAEITDSQPGGVIQVASGATFTLQSGSLIDNATAAHKGNGGAIGSIGGTINIEGGTVKGGTACFGGSIYTENGALTISGDAVIENGSATGNGGNIYVASSGTLNITGGIVRNSTSADNIYVCGTVTLTLPDMANETAIALDGQILATSSATVNANIGVTELDATGNRIWYNKEAKPEAIPGDFTGDHIVTNDDVIALLWHSLFPDTYPLEGNGDLNNDTTITNDDVIVLLWHSLFPEENPL